MPNYGGKAVYVGNLPDDIREKDLDEFFRKFGRIVSIDLKHPPKPPPFAFVEFSDARDAEEAAYKRNGCDLFGSRVRVEVARGGTGTSMTLSRGGSGYKLQVKYLPKSTSWQDLKDFFRKYAVPRFADVYPDRGGTCYGIVEFDSRDDMRLALRKLDDTEFRTSYGSSRISLSEYNSREDSTRRRKSRSRSRSRSPSRSRRRSRSRSGGRSRSLDKKERSPAKSRSEDNSDVSQRSHSSREKSRERSTSRSK